MNGTVSIVDDDPAVRQALSSLVRSVGLAVTEHPSALAYLDAPRPPGNACVVLDVRMPGLSGLDLQQRLLGRNDAPPLVFITAHGDVPMAVRAMKAGAIEFLQKPFRDDDLLAAVWSALRIDEDRQAARLAAERAREQHATLTEREREVLGHVIQGRLNKQIGAALGISEQTIKVHRHNLMRKLDAASVADLVRLVELVNARSPSVG